MPRMTNPKIKCCGRIMNQVIYFRYKLCAINCKVCPKHRDINIPEYINPVQYEKYIVEKYLELQRKEDIILNNLYNDIHST